MIDETPICTSVGQMAGEVVVFASLTECEIK